MRLYRMSTCVSVCDATRRKGDAVTVSTAGIESIAVAAKAAGDKAVDMAEQVEQARVVVEKAGGPPSLAIS